MKAVMFSTVCVKVAFSSSVYSSAHGKKMCLRPRCCGWHCSCCYCIRPYSIRHTTSFRYYLKFAASPKGATLLAQSQSLNKGLIRSRAAWQNNDEAQSESTWSFSGSFLHFLTHHEEKLAHSFSLIIPCWVFFLFLSVFGLFLVSHSALSNQIFAISHNNFKGPSLQL